MPPLSKEKKNYIKLRESQVMFNVDQRGRVKYKSDDLSSNWLDVFFNLTKDMTRFLLSDQFQNIELDSNRIPLNINAYVSMLTLFYIDGYALGFWI